MIIVPYHEGQNSLARLTDARGTLTFAQFTFFQ